MTSRDARNKNTTRPQAAEQLAAKTSELSRAERELGDAESRLDVSAIMRAQAEIAALTHLVGPLRIRAAQEAEAGAREEAQALGTQLGAAYADHLSMLAPAAENAREAIRKATLAARECYAHWNDAAQARHEIDVLELRFGPLGAILAPLPEAPNVAVAVFDEAVAGTTLNRPRFIPVVRRASDTPEERRAAELDAFSKYAKKHTSELSPEMRMLLEKLPPAGLTPPETQEQRQRRERKEAEAERQARRMFDAVEAEKRALEALRPAAKRSSAGR